MKVSFNYYVRKNKFKKNVNSALKYLRRYDIEKFNLKMEKFYKVKGRKSVSKKQPFYLCDEKEYYDLY